MGQNQCNCFNKKTETQLNLNIDQEQAIVKAQQINNENFPSENNSNIMKTYQSENIKTPHHSQIVTIQKVFRGIYFRDKFNQLKPLLQKEENEFITNTIERFNVIQFEKYEMLNPNYNNPISCGITTSIKKYNCKLLIENQFNTETNEKYSSIYFGQVSIDYFKNGFGTLITSLGKKYVGYWIQNQMNSLGRMTDITEECTTEGQFMNSKLNGQGKRYYDGCIYEGEFKNDLREGKGKEETVEYAYSGEFKNDKKEGYGEVNYILTKDSYKGNFKDNSITGKGIYTWANKHTFQGEFLNGKMHGEGIYTWPEGGYYKGHYVDNIKEGYGEFKWSNGKEYKGMFKGGKPYGKGILISNGKEKNVEFKDNGQMIEV